MDDNKWEYVPQNGGGVVVAKKRVVGSSKVVGSNPDIAANDLLSTTQVKQFFGPTSQDVPGKIIEQYYLYGLS